MLDSKLQKHKSITSSGLQLLYRALFFKRTKKYLFREDS